MSDELIERKKWSKIVLENREEGRVVCILTPDEWGAISVSEIIKQPVDGLLWDLNRDEATALSFMDKEGMTHWVNNFAVAMVIRELHSQLEASQQKVERLREIAINVLITRIGFTEQQAERKVDEQLAALEEQEL